MSDFTNYPGYDTSGAPEPMERDEERGMAEGELVGEEAKSRLRNAASGVAERFKGAGRYFRETDMRGMATDMTDMVRRYPMQSLLCGVGIGYLMGRIRRHG